MLGLGLLLVFGVVLALVKLAFELLFLPFKLLGWLLLLPFLALKLIFGLLAGAFLMVVVPLLPFLLLGGLAWLVFSAMRGGPVAPAGTVLPPMP